MNRFLKRPDVVMQPQCDYLWNTAQINILYRESAAMVGDLLMDMKIGKDIGACSIGVLSCHSNREALQKAGADIIIERACDILQILH